MQTTTEAPRQKQRLVLFVEGHTLTQDLVHHNRHFGALYSNSPQAHVHSEVGEPSIPSDNIAKPHYLWGVSRELC